MEQTWSTAMPQVARYIELHIEQGPVLESLGRPLGVVESIIGQARLMVEVRGVQGHAGTVPMSLRKDPMAGAAEIVHTIEGICQGNGNGARCCCCVQCWGGLVCWVCVYW